MAGITYRVYFTPKSGPGNIYGTEVEVTDKVAVKGVARIRRAIDSTDYDIGIFTYDDLVIKAINQDGYFNDSSDTRSLFFWGRDLCKVRVVFSKDYTDTIVFRGLINDEATRLDASGDMIEFRVLSRDSIVRNTKVAGGTISSGYTATQAFLAVLLDPKITAVLTVDEANINPDYDFILDDGSAFADKTAREVLSDLLFASNSVMIIDSTDTVMITSREENTDRDIVNLYGPYQINQKQNVIRMTGYNNGLQRRITSMKINDVQISNDAYVQTYGFRQKSKTLDFITTEATESAIATTIVSEFQVPKVEAVIDVSSEVARNIQLLDRVSLDWPLRLKPYSGKFMPMVGHAVIDDSSTPLPFQSGSVSIPPAMAFKVIEINEDPNTFETSLKIRQVGSTESDGWYTTPGTCAIIGFHQIDGAVICGDGNACDSYNPSVIGAARVGCTETA